MNPTMVSLIQCSRPGCIHGNSDTQATTEFQNLFSGQPRSATAMPELRGRAMSSQDKIRNSPQIPASKLSAIGIVGLQKDVTSSTQRWQRMNSSNSCTAVVKVRIKHEE